MSKWQPMLDVAAVIRNLDTTRQFGGRFTLQGIGIVHIRPDVLGPRGTSQLSFGGRRFSKKHDRAGCSSASGDLKRPRGILTAGRLGIQEQPIFPLRENLRPENIKNNFLNF